MRSPKNTSILTSEEVWSSQTQTPLVLGDQTRFKHLIPNGTKESWLSCDDWERTTQALQENFHKRQKNERGPYPQEIRKGGTRETKGKTPTMQKKSSNGRTEEQYGPLLDFLHNAGAALPWLESSPVSHTAPATRAALCTPAELSEHPLWTHPQECGHQTPSPRVPSRGAVRASWPGQAQNETRTLRYKVCSRR